MIAIPILLLVLFLCVVVFATVLWVTSDLDDALAFLFAVFFAVVAAATVLAVLFGLAKWIEAWP